MRCVQNTCQSGPAYCCSPTGATNSGDKSDGDSKAGTTCVAGATTCSSITICCNNLQQGSAPSVSAFVLHRPTPHPQATPGVDAHVQSQFCIVTFLTILSTTNPKTSIIPSTSAPSKPSPSPSSLQPTLANGAAQPSDSELRIRCLFGPACYFQVGGALGVGLQVALWLYLLCPSIW